MEVLGKDVKQLRKKLVDFIKKEVQKAGFNKVIIGLSGGIDSSLSAFLAVEALGKDGVVGVKMPHGGVTNPESTSDADLIIESLGIKSYTVDIAGPVDAYFKLFPDADNVRRGNKMARERMSVLYDLSKQEKALVLGTGNKTEVLLGYFTLHGDEACDINPLSSIYKTQVWALAKEVQVPEKVIEKTPSADLWEGQTDEGELGITYAECDRLLYHMIDKKHDEKKLVKDGFSKDFLKKVKNRIKNSEFKRKIPLLVSK